DRFAGSGRVTEAEAPTGPRVLAVVLLGQLELVGGPLQIDAAILLVPLQLSLRDRRLAVAVAVQLRLDLCRRDQLGQHSGQRVDLVAAQLPARREPTGGVA